MEVEKWKRFFTLMAKGKLRPNANGKFVVSENQSGGTTEEPSVQFVTPLAHAVELAKSEIRDEAKVYKRKTNARVTPKRKKGGTSNSKNKRTKTANRDAFSD